MYILKNDKITIISLYLFTIVPLNYLFSLKYSLLIRILHVFDICITSFCNFKYSSNYFSIIFNNLSYNTLMGLVLFATHTPYKASKYLNHEMIRYHDFQVQN